jgi:enterochelin esterase-like enzyme
MKPISAPSWSLRSGVARIALAVAGVLTGCGAPAGASARGSVRDAAFHSAAIDGVEHYAVYLPAGYASSTKRYPVIYALHGLPGRASSYRRMGIASWGRDAEQAGRPAIVVAPQGARKGDTDPEWHDWGPGREWETLVFRDVVGHVDRTYRTIASRRGRAIIGVSAGGYGASIIGVRHPAVFSVIESWSGYFHPTNPAGNAPLDVGGPEEDKAASVHTYVASARSVYRRFPTRLGFFVGDEDKRFLAENQALHRELLEAGVHHAYAVYPGGHTGTFWAAHEQQWIDYAVAFLRPVR